MTAKETKIRESWIAKIGEEKYNEVKEVISQHGWLNVESVKVSFEVYSIIVLSMEFEDRIDPLSLELLLRPKSINL